jgi:DNA-binding SARP family transcriptional activator
MVRQAPLRERRWVLALAQCQAGRQGEALRTLRQLRSTLVRELGHDPGPEVAALEQAICGRTHRWLSMPQCATRRARPARSAA